MNKFTAASSVGLVFLLILLASCGGKAPPRPSASPKAVVDRTPELAGEPVPFQLKVVDEVNDGHYLYLKVNLTAQSKWDLSQLIIRLTGLDAGRIVRVQHYSVARLIEKSRAGSSGDNFIQPGETRELSLMLASDSLSDYQLELLWGDEAAPLITAAATEETHAVKLENLEITKKYQCTQVPCDIYFTFQARLKNETPQVLEEVTLGIGFTLKEKNSDQILTQTNSEDEVMLKVENLDLAPGATKLLKIDFDQPVPELVNAEYKPVVRVVEHE